MPPFIFKDQTLILGGSTSVSLLIKKLKNLKEQNKFPKNSDVDFYYHSIGSAASLKRIFDDSFYIGFLSRKPTKKEIEHFANQNQELIKDIRLVKIAEDDIIFGYHLPQSCKLLNGETQLNFSWNRLQKIFSNKQSYWNDVEGVTCLSKEKIYRINRENGSGTRTVFDQKIAQPNIYFESQIGSTSTILNRILNNQNTLSYFSQAHVKEVEDYHKKSSKINYATIENASLYQNNYRFQRSFYALYLQKNKNKIQDFINFYQSEKVIEAIENNGYRWKKWEESKI